MSSTIEAHNNTMTFKTNEIELATVSLFFLILSLIGVVWTFTSGLIGSGIDGILLLGVGLLMAGVFALQLLFIARDMGLVKFPQMGPAKKAAAPAAKPPAAAPPPASPSAAGPPAAEAK
ncbi:MAG: hypothetical protein WAN24_05330 [Candidatus Acidiferrales bacterium]|jgi:hypothetical protein